jgi:hypothetical protein
MPHTNSNGIGILRQIVSCGPVQIEIHLPPEGMGAELIRGSENPPLGWIAPSFDEKIPTTTMYLKEQVTGTVTRQIRFRIQILNSINQ